MIEKLKQEISKVCKIFFIFALMPKVKHYRSMKVITLFFLVVKNVRAGVENICSRLDGCSIVKNVCVDRLTVKNKRDYNHL